MNGQRLGWCLLAALLGGCGKPAAQAGSAPTGSGAGANTMRCTIDGATTFSASDERVSLASLGGNASAVSLGLGMHADSIGRTHDISTGLLALPMAPGSYQFPKAGTQGFSLASYRIRNDKNETLEEFTGSGYSQFYALGEQDPQARLVLELTRFQKLPGSAPNTQRVSLAGSFRFNAAYAPYVNGNLPDACVTEAMTRSMHNAGKAVSYPRFDAGVCGASRRRVECKFDLTGNLIML